MSTHAGEGDRQFSPSEVKDAASQIDPRQRADLLLRDLRSSRSELSPREAQRRLDQYGPNEIHRRARAGHARAGPAVHPPAGIAVVGGGGSSAAGQHRGTGRRDRRRDRPQRGIRAERLRAPRQARQ